MAYVIAVRNVPLDSDVCDVMHDWLGATFEDHWVMPQKFSGQSTTIGFFLFSDKQAAEAAYNELRKTPRRLQGNRLYFTEPEPRRSKPRDVAPKPTTTKPKPEPKTEPKPEPKTEPKPEPVVAATPVSAESHEIIRPKAIYKCPDPSVMYTLPFTVAGFAFWTEYWNHQTHLVNLFSVRYGVRLLRENAPSLVRFVGPQEALDRALAAADTHFTEGLFQQEFNLQADQNNDWIQGGAKHLLLPHIVLPVASKSTGPNSVMFYSFSRNVLRTSVELLVVY
jgi:hypothetical protein